MIPQFTYHTRLGAGYFGEVWLATDLALGVRRAVKLIKPSKIANPNNFFEEAQFLKGVEHPNIVRVEQAGCRPDGMLYIAMEYLEKGSLEDEAQGAYIPLTRARRIMIDVLRGLEKVHGEHLLHRDIKPANILIGNNGEGKLSDFGLAIPVKRGVQGISQNDYNYIYHQAPELFQGSPHSYSTDIYACGITMYRLINGDMYLPRVDDDMFEDKVCNGTLPDRKKYRMFVPRPLRTVVNTAIHVDVEKRYSSALAMRRALERVVIQKNWNEKQVPSGIVWRCAWDHVCYEVSLFVVKGKGHTVTVRKGRSRARLRRLSRLCAGGLSKKEAERHAAGILQRFVRDEL